MIAAEVQFYDVVVWLHVSAVVVGFGPTFAFGLYAVLTQKNHPRAVPAVIAAQMMVVRTMVTGGMLVILATGIYLLADRWELSDFFIAWGILALLVLFGLAHGYFHPHDRRSLELAERDIAASGQGDVKFSEEFEAETARSARMGPIAGLIVILTIYVMTTKPFL